MFTFQFLNDKIYSYIKKKPYGTWQFGKIGVLANSIIPKLKSKHLVCLSFLWRQVFLREWQKIFYTYSGPRCILSLKPKCPIFSHMSWTGKGRDTKTSVLWNMDIDTVKASSFGTKMIMVQSTLNKVPIFHSPLCVGIEILNI